MSRPALLDVRNLSVAFESSSGPVRAVRDVSFTVRAGEILGIVGESGCGKSATALSILRLIEKPGRITGGEVLFAGFDLLSLSDHELRRVRGRRIAMVFQDPTASLNPVMTVGRQIGGVIHAHQRLSRAEADRRTRELLAEVGISDPDMRAGQFPHELSGGMRQRVMIAMALANNPALIIADEPTTALDVTIQAQILDLLRWINTRANTSIVFISHNLGVVAELCHRVAVLYAGRVVEVGATHAVFADPRHPYTRALLGSLPVPGAGPGRLTPVAGAPPVLVGESSGCAFAPRCPLRMGRCTEDPALRALDVDHAAACWAADEAAQIPPGARRPG